MAGAGDEARRQREQKERKEALHDIPRVYRVSEEVHLFVLRLRLLFRKQVHLSEFVGGVLVPCSFV